MIYALGSPLSLIINSSTLVYSYWRIVKSFLKERVVLYGFVYKVKVKTQEHSMFHGG